MIAFKDLKEILRITLEWENKLKDFYDVAEFALKNEQSKEAVRLIRNKHIEKLEILRDVKPESFGKMEWIRFTLDYKEEDLIPVGKIQRSATAGDIFNHLLDYEEKLKNIYSRVAENLVSRNHKELFESLVLFKEEQIAEVRRLRG